MKTGKPEGKKPLGDQGIDGKDNIKIYINRSGCKVLIGITCPRSGSGSRFLLM
jgi:hypothetical protein